LSVRVAFASSVTASNVRRQRWLGDNSESVSIVDKGILNYSKLAAFTILGLVYSTFSFVF